MNKFDPHAAIKELAEAGWECWASGGLGETDGHDKGCICKGTGRVVLFPALRVDKQGVWSHRDCVGMGICENLLADGSPVYPVTDCEGRGWVPEPDVRAACWEIGSNSEIMSNVTFNTSVQKWQWYDREGLPSHRGWTSVDRREEAVLRAALAWVKA